MIVRPSAVQLHQLEEKNVKGKSVITRQHRENARPEAQLDDCLPNSPRAMTQVCQHAQPIAERRDRRSANR
jgi:hypothetical protein